MLHNTLTRPCHILCAYYDLLRSHNAEYKSHKLVFKHPRDVEILGFLVAVYRKHPSWIFTAASTITFNCLTVATAL